MFYLEALSAVDPHAGEVGWMSSRSPGWRGSKSAAAAGQARAAAALDEQRRADDAAAGVPKAKQGRGVAGEVALARHDSPARGGRHLGFAKALGTRDAAHPGRAGVRRALRVALDVDRAANRPAWLSRTGDCWMPSCALMSASSRVWGMRGSPRRPRRLPPGWMQQAVVDRAAKAEADRTVTIRPAPDCMTHVTVLLPVAQGVGVFAALKRAADTTFDDRSPRAGDGRHVGGASDPGTPAEEPEHVALNLVMSDQALWGQDNAPAVLDGYGPK